MAFSSSKKEFGQSPGQLGFADAGGSQEDETSDGTVGVLQAGSRAHDRFRDRLDGLVLPDHPFVQLVFQMQQLLHFAFEELGNRARRSSG